jgi:hypothetical protein
VVVEDVVVVVVVGDVVLDEVVTVGSCAVAIELEPPRASSATAMAPVRRPERVRMVIRALPSGCGQPV